MKDEVLKRIDALADKLGVAASYIFKLYVQQARVEVLQDFGLLLIGIMLLWMSIKATQYFLADTSSLKRVPFVVGGVLGCILATILLISFLCSGVWTAMLNPQFWAFQQILHDIHGQ